jgi:uncharacterized protein YggE
MMVTCEFSHSFHFSTFFRETSRMKRSRKFLLTSILTFGLALSGVTASGANAETRQITVSAEGKVSVTPDAVRTYATVSLVRASSKTALESANGVSSKVRAAFLANGVDRKEIRTQSVTVYPEYNYSQDKGSTLVGYRASQSFDVVIKNASTAGSVVDAIVAAGGDDLQVNSVSPFVFDAASATASARENAVKNARAKARSYASLLEVKLGKVISLVEGSAPTYGGPIFAMEKNDAGSTVIDLGQQEVTVTVTVKWSIR